MKCSKICVENLYNIESYLTGTVLCLKIMCPVNF